MELDYVKLREIKPALSGYIRKSQVMLKKSDIPDEEVVHDVRVLMKKSRSVLKLIYPQMDKEYVDKDCFALREVGRFMSLWREASVYRKSLKELRKEFPGIFTELEDNKIISEILNKPEPSLLPSEEIKIKMDSISDILTRTGYRIRFQSMNKLDPQLLLKQLELTYSGAAKLYLVCRNNPKQRHFHEFRKKTKEFLYQLWFFKPLNPSSIKLVEKRLGEMTKNLGKYNDLAQLIRALGYKYSEKESFSFLDELVIRIREKQDDCLSKVWPSAYKIFCPGQKLVNVLGFKLLVI